jgi:hypothetical protein
LIGVQIDYDSGDSFQVELGENDVTCEIDGVEFSCTDWAQTSEPFPDLDVTIRTALTWEGEFRSDSEADVVEIYTVTCSGESCEVVEDILCTYKATYSAHAV